jgi:hypothetical protein
MFNALHLGAAQIPGQPCTKNCAVQAGVRFAYDPFGTAAGPLYRGGNSSESASRMGFRFGQWEKGHRKQSWNRFC